MENIKYIFIVNPVAGNGKAEIIFKNILKFAQEDNMENELLWNYTYDKNVAKYLAVFYSEQFPDATIYSVGGDGTLNEIINGIKNNTKLGIIPAGSGNDFYRVSKNIKGTKKINLGVVNGHKFINIASLGFDARVANKANELKNKNKKMLVYPRAILDILKNNQAIEYTMDNIKNKSTVLVIGNGKYYGNGVPINPNYDLKNDYLNVLKAPFFNRRDIVKFLLKVLKEKHIDDPLLDYYLVKKLNIVSDEELICNVDGEIITSKEFNFEVIKDGVTIDNNYPRYVKKAINLIK